MGSCSSQEVEGSTRGLQERQHEHSQNPAAPASALPVTTVAVPENTPPRRPWGWRGGRRQHVKREARDPAAAERYADAQKYVDDVCCEDFVPLASMPLTKAADLTREATDYEDEQLMARVVCPDGQNQSVPDHYLLPGMVVQLKQFDVVPADVIILGGYSPSHSQSDLNVDERIVVVVDTSDYDGLIAYDFSSKRLLFNESMVPEQVHDREIEIEGYSVEIMSMMRELG